MPSRYYRWDGEKVQDIGLAESSGEVTAAVIDDTMDPLKHPVTGKVYDSKRRYLADTKRMGYEVVGNDLLSRQKRELPERITESKVIDACHRAEAIQSDPCKLNGWRNRQIELAGQMERLSRR